MNWSEAALSRRERQIMDILFRLGSASAADVQEALDDPPSYSAVRASLRILEEKGHVRHVTRDRQYVYLPTSDQESAQRAALERIVNVFFGGSPGEAISALIDQTSAEMSEDEFQEIAALIEQARAEDR